MEAEITLGKREEKQTMNPNLFRVALDHLQPSDWSTFEVICGQFLLPELGTLRTMAHPQGDGGRDSELFSPDGQPFVAAQYSVTGKWKPKIRQTAKTSFRGISFGPRSRLHVKPANRWPS